MRNVLMILIIFISGCSGSLTDSGILWSEDKALNEQAEKKAQIAQATKTLEKNEQTHSKAKQDVEQLQKEIDAIEYKINITKRKIKILQSESSNDKQKLESLQYELKKHETAKANLERKQEINLQPKSPPQVREDDMNL